MSRRGTVPSTSHPFARNEAGSRLKNEFPTFSDGDVKLVISGSRQYQLHSNVLTSFSRVFRELISGANVARLSEGATRRGVVVRTRIDAVTYYGEVEGPVHVALNPVPLDSEGRPVERAPVAVDRENGGDVPAVYVAYHKVLGCFYNIPLTLGEHDGGDLQDIMHDAYEVMRVAEWLDVIPMVNKEIEISLLQTGQRIFQSIARWPAPWLNFASRIKSRILYQEALIHSVGQYNTKELRSYISEGDVNPNSVETVKRKAEELNQAVRDVEIKILTYYPAHLTRQAAPSLAAGSERIARQSYANDITSWQSLVVFRHWFAQQIWADQTHHAADMGFSVLEPIYEGGEAYLSSYELQTDFHGTFPMTGKGRKTLEARVRELQEHARRLVRPFFRNRSRIDLERHQVGFFTCVRVGAGDFHWEDKTEGSGEKSESEEENMGGSGDGGGNLVRGGDSSGGQGGMNADVDVGAERMDEGQAGDRQDRAKQGETTRRKRKRSDGDMV